MAIEGVGLQSCLVVGVAADLPGLCVCVSGGLPIYFHFQDGNPSCVSCRESLTRKPVTDRLAELI